MPEYVDPEACRALARRCLELAIHDAHNPPKLSADEGDALEWLADDSEHAWSFRWVCYHLRLDPGAARRAILKEG